MNCCSILMVCSHSNLNFTLIPTLTFLKFLLPKLTMPIYFYIRNRFHVPSLSEHKDITVCPRTYHPSHLTLTFPHMCAFPFFPIPQNMQKLKEAIHPIQKPFPNLLKPLSPNISQEYSFWIPLLTTHLK